MKINDLLKPLNHFLFAPASPLPMALVRICMGLIVLQDMVIHLLPDFKLYYGENAIIPIESTISKYWFKEPNFDLMLVLPHDDTWRFALFILCIVAAFCMTIGLFSRISMITVFLCLLSFDSHQELNQNDGDVFIRLACMILCFSNAGDALSIDNLLRSLRQDWRVTGFANPLSAPWAQRWLQLQLAFVYWHAAMSKIAGEGWVSGLACYNSSRYEDCMRFPVPVLFDNLFTIKCLTWGTILIEISLFTLVWFQEFRYWVLLGGLALHLGIEWTMNLPMFGWAFMSSYFAFVASEDLAKVMDRVRSYLHRLLGEPATLVFDSQILTQVHMVGFIRRLDIFHFLNLVDLHHKQSFNNLTNIPPVNAQENFLLLTKKGWLGGFYAFKWMTMRLPLLIFLMPFFYLPGLSYFSKLFCHVIGSKLDFIFGTDDRLSMVQAVPTQEST